MMDMKRIYNILLIMILSLFLLPLGGCFDSDINRSMYEADGEEMQRENHIVGATLKGMQGLVIPTREHLYQFMDAMAGGANGDLSHPCSGLKVENFITQVSTIPSR